MSLYLSLLKEEDILADHLYQSQQSTAYPLLSHIIPHPIYSYIEVLNQHCWYNIEIENSFDDEEEKCVWGVWVLPIPVLPIPILPNQYQILQYLSKCPRVLLPHQVQFTRHCWETRMQINIDVYYFFSNCIIFSPIVHYLFN